MKRVAEPIGSEMNAFDVISLTTEVPRQNRVTPEGELITVSDRGMFLGNRGVLHDRSG